MPHRNNRATRHTRFVGLLALSAAVVVPTVAVAAPGSSRALHRTPRQTLTYYSERYETPIAPGVDLEAYSSPAAGHLANSNIVTVDLTHPGVSTAVLSKRVTDTETTAGLAADSGAVTAVNGDYFDIYGTSAPEGAVIRGGVLQKGDRAGQSMTGLGTDGELRTSTVYLNGTVTWGSSPAHALDVYNSDLSGATSMPKNGLAVFDGTWGNAPLSFPHAPKKVSVVLVNSSHKIIATYPKLPTRVTVPAHGMVLVGTGTYAGIAGLKKGTKVTDTIAATTDAGFPFQWGLGAGLQLMRNGGVIHNYPDDTDPHDARTALGWSADGKTMYLVTVSTGGSSIGEGVNEIADEMAAAGAYDAVLLDGGGSTTLIAREQGDATNTDVGEPASGYQRHVPIAIGVFVPRGSGQVFGFTPTLDAGTVFPGLHRQLDYHAWDEWFGAATLDPTIATVTTDNPGLLQQSGPNQILALRQGTGHVIATAPTTAPGSPGTATGGVYVRVLDTMTSLQAPAAIRLTPGTTTPVAVTGSDAEGDTAPILGSDITASFDPSLLAVTPDPNGQLDINVKAVPEGEVTPVTITAAGVSTTIVVHIGFATVPLLNPAKTGTLRVTGGGAAIVPVRTGVAGLRISPTGKTASAIATPSVAFPTGTAKLSVLVTGDGGKHALTAVYVDAGGHQHKVSLGTVTGKTPERLEVGAPGTGTFTGIVVGATTTKHGGFVVITGINART